MTAALRVTGVRPVAGALRGLGGDVDEQADAIDRVAVEAAAEVSRRTPRRSGLLAADVTAERLGSRAVVTQGRRAVYAGARNYGFRARNIEPSHHLQAVDPVIGPRAVLLIDQNTDKLIQRRGLR